MFFFKIGNASYSLKNKLLQKSRDIDNAIHKHEMFLENQRNSYIEKEQEIEQRLNEFNRK